MNPQGVGVSSSLYKNIKQSSTHPKFLHSNSTSHVWAFSAIAELIDNASDPDVQATELHIDAELDGVPRLTFTDNGFGMPPPKLHKMLSFGYCEKVEINGHKPIGHYGNGFKSGSMRLGRDALVFTKFTDSMSCGFLSQTFLDATQSDCVLVPMVTWNLNKKLLMSDMEAQENLAPMYGYSPFSTMDALLRQFEHIKKTGTRIVIFNLRKDGNMLEFNFDEDKRDLRIRGDNQVAGTVGAAGRKFQRQRVNQDPTTDIPLDYSLRAYCEVLYLRPRMLLYIRTFKVRTKMIAHSLTKTKIDTYRPYGLNLATKITFGLNGENLNVYGMMLYHRNRLIKPYVRVGIQLQNNKEGVGVIGVIEADFLQPTHNKQDFDYTPAYRRCIAKLSDLLEVYWYDIKKNPLPAPKKTPAPHQPSAPSSNAVVPIAKPAQSQIILLPYTDAPIPSDPNAKPDIIPFDGASASATSATAGEFVSETSPDETWVQCDSCLKWRKLPASTRADALPDKWYCYMNTSDPARSDCAVPQQADDEPDDVANLRTVRKKQKEMEKMAIATKRAEEAKRAALIQQEEMMKKQAEEKRLRDMEAETNKLKIEQEKQRKIIEDQQRREQQYQEQVRAFKEKEMLQKQKEAQAKAEEEKKRKEIETWLQDEESNLKKRKTTDDEPPLTKSGNAIHIEPKIETPAPAFSTAASSSLSSSSGSISSSIPPPISVHTQPAPVPLPPSSSSSSSTSVPPKPLSTAIKRLSQPAPTSPSSSSSSSSQPTHISSQPTHITSSPPAPTPIPPSPTASSPRVPPSPAPASPYVAASPYPIPVYTTPVYPTPTPMYSSPSPVPVSPAVNFEMHNKAFANMAALVNSLNLPGVAANADAASLASLDVTRIIEQAHTAFSAKPRAELTNLRQWVKKLLVLLARSKDITVEDAELDSYFVEWVKRQETKRKPEA